MWFTKIRICDHLKRAVLLLNLLLESMVTSTRPDTFNVYCDTYLDVIPTHPTFKYIPYFVRLHRCQGKDIIDGHPTIRHCVPKTQTPLVYPVELSDFSLESPLNITLYNHTACTYTCKEDSTRCARGTEWHEPSCSCCVGNRTDCARGYTWSSTECTCVPQIAQITFPTVATKPKRGPDVNASVAAVDDTPCLRYQIVIAIVVAELVVVIMLCVFVFYGICRRGEVTYNLSVKRRPEGTISPGDMKGQVSVCTNQTSSSTEISVQDHNLYSNRYSAEIPDTFNSNTSTPVRSNIGSLGSKGSVGKEDAICEDERGDVVINGSLNDNVYYVKKVT